MRRFVLDTNVYIEAMRQDAAREALEVWQRRMAPAIWQHAVVVAELLVGAKDELTHRRWHSRWVAPSERVGRVVTPSYASWRRASRIVALLRAAHLLGGPVKPGFLNDCLLAATAREYGHAIVTHNRADFERIARVEPGLEVLAPLP